ncbi:hypothetical protein SAY86_006287 [Trapa natans]|uniref:TCP domain-containing protein n=1 Tax=Trapa natans TaxID=22666 RepID=A0AAN7QT72_TRANT|nr:hypothetical protein SAY86_006287 [Trapa natans]
MELEEIQTHAPPPKLPRVDLDSLKVGRNYPVEEEDGNLKLLTTAGGGAAAAVDGGSADRLHRWHGHSRIIRVSRATGGKDRHSKVLTSKGLRDRRVRLSVSTAIQFYDIQDRLGYDQPSKAVEWLIKAASDAISELPALDTFIGTPKQPRDGKRASEGGEQGFIDSADVEMVDDPSHQQHASLSKSACSSSPSETSKGSSLSLSRSEIRAGRVKRSRERARERSTAKVKVGVNGEAAAASMAAPPISQSSFTELLITAGIASISNGNNHHLTGLSHQPNPMDYISTRQLLSRPAQNLPGILGQIQFPQAMPLHVPHFSISGYNNSSDNSHHQEVQHISFLNSDHLNLIPVAASSMGEADYNLNFTISPSAVSSSSSSSPGLIGGFSRGPLQSNLPHLHTSLQHHVDGSTTNVNLPFFMGAAAMASAAETSARHQNQQLHPEQFSSGINGKLQLYYGDGNRQGGGHREKASKS